MRRTAALAFVAFVCLPASALAANRAHDVAATRTYLRAEDAFEVAANAELPAGVEAIAVRGSAIGSECPSALTYAPRDEAFEELGEEATGSALFSVGFAQTRSSLQRLTNAVAPLRWSSHRIARLVQAQVAEDRGLLELPPAPVCADIAVWKASAYATSPSDEVDYVKRVRAIQALAYLGLVEEEREEVILRLLRRYESPPERQLAKRLRRLEDKFERTLGKATEAASAKLAAALGVSTL